MFGNLFSSVVRAATLPIDGANALFDLATGGDGSKASRNSNVIPNPLSMAESARDTVADAADDMDVDPAVARFAKAMGISADTVRAWHAARKAGSL